MATSDAGTLSMEELQERARAALAPILIGCFINLVLYGLALCWQGRYWLFYRGDHWSLRILVLFQMLVDTLGTLGSCAMTYRMIIIQYGDPSAWTQKNWQWPVVMLTTAVTTACTHAFLVARLHRFARKWWITLALSSACVATFACGMWVSILYATHTVIFGRRPASMRKAVATWVATTVGADVLLCVTIVYFLAQLGKFQYVNTRHVMRQLFGVALFSASTLVGLELACLIAYLCLATSTVPFCILMVTARAYTLTLLINLNVRQHEVNTVTPLQAHLAAVTGFLPGSGGQSSQRQLEFLHLHEDKTSTSQMAVPAHTLSKD